MNNQFKSLDSILKKLMRDIGIDQKIEQSRAIIIWPKIVGKRIAEVSKPEKVVNGILFVRVKSAVWRSEFVFMKYKILNKLEKELGKNVVNDIRFLGL